MPATVGAVSPGSPAYQAGLRPGDEIVAIDGRRDLTYRNLLDKVLLSSRARCCTSWCERPGHEA